MPLNKETQTLKWVEQMTDVKLLVSDINIWSHLTLYKRNELWPVSNVATKYVYTSYI